MKVDVVATVSEPGDPDKANEDAAGAAGPFAWVIDGATGLGDERLIGGPSDAAWLTAALDAALAAAAVAATHADAAPEALLAAAAGAIEARWFAERRRAPREQYELPTAAVLVARFDGDGVRIAELGDCAIYLAVDGRVIRYGGTAAGRAAEQDGARRLGSLGRASPELLEYLRSVRNRANAPGGYATFAPDATCAARARLHHHAAEAGEALLMTDGYEAAVEDYGLYSEPGLMAAAGAAIATPLAELRAVERADAACVRYPRFKPSDDATALLVRFGARSHGA